MNRRKICFGLVAGTCSLHQALAGLADTVPVVKRSIVLVGTFKATDNPRFQLRGTGFLVDKGQTVVTNSHVVPDTPGVSDDPILVVQILRTDGQWERREISGIEKDVPHDLALLRMEGDPGVPMRLASSDRVREGDDLAFMGFPIGSLLGFSPVTHRATVSSITVAALPSPSARQLQDKAVRGLRNGTFDIFQLDATAYPGNSGGPLFNPDTGEVLGVMNMVLIKNTRESALSQPSGISYAIPVRHVRELLDRQR